MVALDATEGDASVRYRQACEEAYAIAAKIGDKKGMVRALVQTGMIVDFWPDYVSQAVSNLRTAMSLSREIGEAGDEQPLMDSRFGLWRFLTREEAEAWSARMVQQYSARHDLSRLKEVYFGMMWSNIVWGRPEEAVACCDEGIRLAGELGVPPVQYPTLKALALLRLGRYHPFKG